MQEAQKCIEEHKARHLRARATHRKDIKEFIRQRRLDMISKQSQQNSNGYDYVDENIFSEENETLTMSKSSQSFRDVALVKLESNDLGHVPICTVEEFCSTVGEFERRNLSAKNEDMKKKIPGPRRRQFQRRRS